MSSMDKKLLKDFAMKSRETLTALVAAKLHAMHVTEDIAWVQKGEVYQAIIDGRNITLYPSDKARYDQLRAAVKTEGIKQVTEKAAYTWFNRIVAIRYMELNEMLPEGKHNEWLGIRVLSDANDSPDPEILKISSLRRSDLDLPLDVDALLKLSRDDEKFREVLFAVVKKLGTVMPDVFNGDTTSINFLLPDNLLGAGGFVNEVLKLPTSCFDRVEVIGWLYQYYNQAEKDIAMKKKAAIEKDEIPYVTQIFTPDWIVKYMVENSLGSYWLEHGGDSSLAQNWKYLVRGGEAPDGIKAMPNIENVTFIDPCAGSGHILVYAFEVFYQIYLSLGYAPELIPEKILTHNLYGLDIDDRAKQLSILSAMLVAREYDKDIFNKNVGLNISSVAESNGLSGLPDLLKGAAKDAATYLIDTFRDAKEYGSILKVKSYDYDTLRDELKGLPPMDEQLYTSRTNQLIHQAEILSRKYTIAVTNPPYMNKYDRKLKEYIYSYYSDSKADLFSVFIEVLLELLTDNGVMGMVTPDSWMFLSGQVQLRERLVNSAHIATMIHLGNGAFPHVVVSTTSFTISKGKSLASGNYIRNILGTEKSKEMLALQAAADNLHESRYQASNADFDVFPGKIIAYWASSAMKRIYDFGNIEDVATVITGMTIGDNNKYMRRWYEISNCKLGLGLAEFDPDKYWVPYSKGGERRNWYGNNEFVVNWSQKNNFNRPKTTCSHLYLKKALTWPFLTSGTFSARSLDPGFLWDVAGSPIFFEDDDTMFYTLGFLCSKVANHILKITNPTLNTQAIDIAKLPLKIDNGYMKEVIEIVMSSLELSRLDWDSFEQSWDFKIHPLLPSNGEIKLSDTYAMWERAAADRWRQLKAYEERLNEIFIEVYGMQGELKPEVEEKYVSVRKADMTREARSLLSYFVGVIFGRYSLDKPGLNFAGGEWNASGQSALVDSDNIVPIMDGEYYTDDIVKKLRDFLVVVYGETTLHANMDWLADALGRKSHENAEDTLRRYFVDDFFADHFKVYGKRPIYWQLSSGKQNGFKALFYLHRYQPNLVATVRTQYLLNTQNIYAKRLAELEAKTTLNNDELRLKNDLVAKLAEIKSYDALIGVAASEAVELDLDDGVKTNYPKLSHAAAGVKPGSEILEMKGVKL